SLFLVTHSLIHKLNQGITHTYVTLEPQAELDQGNSPEMNVAKMAGRNVNGVTKKFIGLLRRYDEPLTFQQR
mgnify:CR=1